MRKPITVVGGGLAGLALGIGLRQREVPVVLWEAGRYPRHRVCGEFISGQGQESLRRLGLLEMVNRARAQQATSAAFFLEQRAFPKRDLPEPALCISRFILDELLAGEFQRLGGELRAGQRWDGKYGEGIVRASGRHPRPITEGWRLFGLKIHASNVPLKADLEVHFTPSGYVGLCRLVDGKTNICGLFRSKTTVPDLAQRYREWLSGPPGSRLSARLSAAQLDEGSLCSVAGLSLAPQRAVDRHECCVGDALTMIPPVTGNGMSMAFESAELAIAPLAKFSRGEMTWAQAQRSIAAQCDARFARRLQWAGRLQTILFRPRLRAALLFLGAHSQWLWRACFHQTR